MSAVLCPMCRQMVTAAHAPLKRTAPGATITDVLQTAALAHLAEFHKAEIARCVEVGNLMTLWAAASLFESKDAAWHTLKDNQADVLLNLILDRVFRRRRLHERATLHRPDPFDEERNQ